MENKEYLVWVDFYTEFANKLRAYQNDRAALIAKSRQYSRLLVLNFLLWKR